MTLIRMEFMRLSRFISKAKLVQAFSFACLAIGTTPAFADLVSPYGGETAPSFAEISVEKDHVRVALEVDLSAYPFFVEPDDGSGASLSERTGQTFFVEADGNPLDRVVTAIDVRPRTLRQTAASKVYTPRPRSADVVFVEMEFPFQGQPKRITFTPPLNPDGIPLASIGMVAEHSGVPVTDYRYLSRPETMLPQWDDPWFTTFENPNLTRHHKSPLMSFLSVEPREVRHEIIFRLKDLEDWIDLNLGEGERLSPDQVAQIKSEAQDFFRTKNPVTIDGASSTPSNVQISHITVGAEGLSVLPDQSPAGRTTMLLGAVLSYPQNVLANQVILNWELFPDGVDTIPVTLSDPAGAVPSQVYKDDPVVRWTNHLTAWEDPQTQPVVVKTAGLLVLPVLAIGLGLAALTCFVFAWSDIGTRRYLFLGLAGASTVAAVVTLPLRQPISIAGDATPDQETTHLVVNGLLNNVSTAMLETDPRTLETALAPFVDPSNRAGVSAEMRRGLSVTLPSGAVARTDDILDLQVESLTPGEGRDDHQILANWTARVSGGHWGHIHRQNVNYRGLIDVSRHGDQWLLDGLTVLTAQKED